mmetsp:Transcript_8318/g.26841  ORF Transcript_8318/g.26841 Transcript_8318/m.26841 type:complete len:293 (-) Transcript_8318:236-1114(-)
MLPRATASGASPGRSTSASSARVWRSASSSSCAAVGIGTPWARARPRRVLAQPPAVHGAVVAGPARGRRRGRDQLPARAARRPGQPQLLRRPARCPLGPPAVRADGAPRPLRRLVADGARHEARLGHAPQLGLQVAVGGRPARGRAGDPLRLPFRAGLAHDVVAWPAEDVVDGLRLLARCSELEAAVVLRWGTTSRAPARRRRPSRRSCSTRQSSASSSARSTDGYAAASHSRSWPSERPRRLRARRSSRGVCAAETAMRPTSAKRAKMVDSSALHSPSATYPATKSASCQR